MAKSKPRVKVPKTAKAGEIISTQVAYEHVNDKAALPAKPFSFTASGIGIDAVTIEWRRGAES